MTDYGAKLIAEAIRFHAACVIRAAVIPQSTPELVNIIVEQADKDRRSM